MIPAVLVLDNIPEGGVDIFTLDNTSFSQLEKHSEN